jgi:hypothetical protein
MMPPLLTASSPRKRVDRRGGVHCKTVHPLRGPRADGFAPPSQTGDTTSILRGTLCSILTLRPARDELPSLAGNRRKTLRSSSNIGASFRALPQPAAKLRHRADRRTNLYQPKDLGDTIRMPIIVDGVRHQKEFTIDHYPKFLVLPKLHDPPGIISGHSADGNFGSVSFSIWGMRTSCALSMPKAMRY